MFFYNLYEHNINQKLFIYLSDCPKQKFPLDFRSLGELQPGLKLLKDQWQLLGYSEGIPEALQYRFNPLLFDESK
jgi:hypothetical protein